MKTYRIAILLLASALATGAHAADVAKVNGVGIPQSRVDIILKQATARGDQKDTPELRKAITDQLIVGEAISQEAVKKGLDRDPDVAAQLDFERQKVLTSAYARDYLKNNPISDSAVKSEYDRLKTENAGAKEYKVRHILVKTEADAKSITEQLKKGGSFEKLAAKSEDPGSKTRGGELGWISLNSVVPEFAAAVSKLKKGQVTDTPVKSQFGWHVIRLDDDRVAKVPSYDEIKPQIQQFLQNQALKKQFDDIKAKAKIE
jgi:peptidyl-prolyl cis-trans isomerase C